MVTSTGRTQQRFARYGAGVLFLGGVGVVFLVGALAKTPLQRLWIYLFWGGVASLALGWAVGHAAGRLYGEVTEQKSGTTPVAEEKSSVEERRSAEESRP
jgi:hypothetical protein